MSDVGDDLDDLFEVQPEESSAQLEFEKPLVSEALPNPNRALDFGITQFVAGKDVAAVLANNKIHMILRHFIISFHVPQHFFMDWEELFQINGWNSVGTGTNPIPTMVHPDVLPEPFREVVWDYALTRGLRGAFQFGVATFPNETMQAGPGDLHIIGEFVVYVERDGLNKWWAVDKSSNELKANYQWPVTHPLVSSVNRLIAARRTGPDSVLSIHRANEDTLITTTSAGVQWVKENQQTRASFASSTNITHGTSKSYALDDRSSQLLIIDNASGDMRTIQVDPAIFERPVNALAADSSDTLLAIETVDGVKVIDSTSMKVCAHLPRAIRPVFGSDGTLRTFNERGQLESRRIKNLDALLAARRLQNAIAAASAVEVSAKAPVKSKKFPHLDTITKVCLDAVTDQVPTISKTEDIEHAHRVLQAYLKRIQAVDGYTAEQLAYIAARAMAHIEEGANRIIGGQMKEVRRRVRGGGLNMPAVSDIQDKMERASAAVTNLPQLARIVADTKEEIRGALEEFFKNEFAQIDAELRALLTETDVQLSACKTPSEIHQWADEILPEKQARLRLLLRNCPPSETRAMERIADTLAELNKRSHTALERIVRLEEAEKKQLRNKMEIMERTIRDDIDQLIALLRFRHFRSRTEAEMELARSGAMDQIEDAIELLKKSDPSDGEELADNLHVRIATFLGEVEQLEKVKQDPSGRQMVPFGSVELPRWDTIDEKTTRHDRRVELGFEEIGNQAPPKSPNDELVKVVALVTDELHRTVKVPLFSGVARELGQEHYRATGESGDRTHALQATIVTKGEFIALQRDFKRNCGDWQRGASKSPLQQKLAELSNDRKAAFRARHEYKKDYAQQNAGSYPDADSEFERLTQEYRNAVEAYAQFYIQNNVSFLRRMDKLRTAKHVEATNGTGLIPRWESYWVEAPEDQALLEKIAASIRLQHEQQAGFTLIEGHAGTGKDVAISMLGYKLNRPVFTFNCTKWTDEFALGEDVIIDNMTTVRVPSVILQAMQVPNAIVNLNEFNAMPDHAQNFFLALFSGERTVRLKTRPGEQIHAPRDTTFIGTMNWGYGGTFNPSLAMLSRGRLIRVDYPPLYAREATRNDPNPPFSASDALKIARNVNSLREFTFEMNPARNAFMQMWDFHVNKENNGAPRLTDVQEADMNVIFALAWYAHNLREEFVDVIEQTPGKTPLPVNQPLSLRELRDCAHELNRIPLDEKQRDPNLVARNLIATCFLTKIKTRADRQEIGKKMATSEWNPKMRTAPPVTP